MKIANLSNPRVAKPRPTGQVMARQDILIGQPPANKSRTLFFRCEVGTLLTLLNLQ